MIHNAHSKAVTPKIQPEHAVPKPCETALRGVSTQEEEVPAELRELSAEMLRMVIKGS
jgi:hypothetical protein